MGRANFKNQQSKDVQNVQFVHLLIFKKMCIHKKPSAPSQALQRQEGGKSSKSGGPLARIGSTPTAGILLSGTINMTLDPL